MASPVTDVLAGIVTLLDADAAFVNVYSRHNIADITLPAFTVGPERCEPRSDEEMFSGGEDLMAWDVTASVRVHTSYIGGPVNQASTVAQVDLVVEKLRENLDAITGCHVLDVKIAYGQEFIESQTVGAQVNVTVLAHAHYIQE